MEQKNILIVSGEASGDMQAANLARAIIAINPALKISAVGGTLLRQAGAEIFYDIKNLSVMGLFDVLRKLPRFFALKKLVLEKIKKDNPSAVILVDFSGFNLRLAKKINQKIPVIYYISPQVWASRSGRVKTIKKFIHKVIVIFAFEKEFYRRYGIDAEFVGHPLLDIVKPGAEKKEFLQKLGLSESKKIIALLPGSRKAEIKNILPLMLKTASLLKKSLGDIKLVIAGPAQIGLEIYQKILKRFDLDTCIIEGKTYDAMNIADFCLVCSGTATIEACLMQKPFLIIYKMDLLNYLLYRPQIKVPYIGMVNIVAQRKIIPEFIQFNACPQKIADQALKILNDPQRLEEMKQALAKVKAALGDPGAASRAARIILNSINSI